jgi:hypothetical protein
MDGRSAEAEILQFQNLVKSANWETDGFDNTPPRKKKR